MTRAPLAFLSFVWLAPAQVCVECHKKVTPGIVSDWQLSKHSQNAVDCATCHGDQHKSHSDVHLVRIPTPETCAQCHETQTFQGTFHASPDYALWYGWNEMQRDLTEIRTAADELRARAKPRK